MRIKNKLDTSRNIWFMSDLHISHENVISMNNRQFSSISEMNEYILHELEKVGEDDILFDLGDFAWNVELSRYKSILSGIKAKEFYKLWGNHDKENIRHQIETRYTLACDLLDICMDDNIRITLCHYPLEDWNAMYHGSWMVHGHCHGNIDDKNWDLSFPRVDIGFDGALCKEVGSFLVEYKQLKSYVRKMFGVK